MFADKLSVTALKYGMKLCSSGVVKRVFVILAILSSIQVYTYGQQSDGTYYLYIKGTPYLNDNVTCSEPVYVVAGKINIRTTCTSSVLNSFSGESEFFYGIDNKNISIEAEFSKNLWCEDVSFSTSGNMSVKILFGNDYQYGKSYTYLKSGAYTPPLPSNICSYNGLGSISYGISPPRPSGITISQKNINGGLTGSPMSLDDNSVYISTKFHTDIESSQTDYLYEVE